MSGPAEIENHRLVDDGRTPNHPEFDLLVMRRTEALDADDPASWFEQRFSGNGWGATWRWKVYPYHHFHSTNHEVLGVSRGEANVMFGGEFGVECHVETGDVIVMPAGVGHKRLEASGDFEVVGAYLRLPVPVQHSAGKSMLARRLWHTVRMFRPRNSVSSNTSTVRARIGGHQ